MISRLAVYSSFAAVMLNSAASKQDDVDETRRGVV